VIKIPEVNEGQSSCVSLQFRTSWLPETCCSKLYCQFPNLDNIENEDVQTLSTTSRLPVFRMLRIIPPARLATATDEDTRRIKNNGAPAAMIAG